MVKVLAIMGSPRKMGNTYKVTKMVEERMKALGDVEFEYVFLRDLNLGMCRGCRLCMEKGEEFCPLKDDRAMLEEKMLGADGVIFASPTYVGNVTGYMKNFTDRFAYACHRHRFFKNAMLLTTSGGGGAGFMLMAFSVAIESTGFKVTSKLSVVTHERADWGTPKERAALEATKIKKVDAAAKKFYASVKAGTPKPGAMDTARFLITKNGHLYDEPGSPDYRYWKEHGWYDKGTYYFYGPKPGLIQKGMALALSKVIGVLAR
jgi:multimeric flavodoxin WrbA